MKKLINDEGINQYQAVKDAYEKAKALLTRENPNRKELSDLLGVFDKNTKGVEWLRDEEEGNYTALIKSLVSKACRAFKIFDIPSEYFDKLLHIAADKPYKKVIILLPDIRCWLQMDNGLIHEQYGPHILFDADFEKIGRDYPFSVFPYYSSGDFKEGRLWRLKPEESGAVYRFIKNPKFTGKTAEEKIMHIKEHIEVYKLFEDTSPKDYSAADYKGDYWFALGKKAGKECLEDPFPLPE